MPDEPLGYDDLLRIVELLKSSEQFSEFRLKVGDIEIEIQRRRQGSAARPGETISGAHPGPSASNSPSTPPQPDAEPRRLQSSAPAAAPEPVRAAEAAWPKDAILIRAPMVGTFYRAPAPGASPFVAVGQTVAPTTTVCIIEVMKLMNSIQAGTTGVVRQILVDDAAPVDTGQALIVLAPVTGMDEH